MDFSLRHENLIIAAYNGRVAQAGDAYLLSNDPCYPTYWHFLGALLRVPVQSSSEDGYAKIHHLARGIWKRSTWPSTILQWPEQTIRDAIAMHRVLGWLGSSEKSMKLCALANWWRGNKVPFSVQNANHFLYAWNTLMGFPEKTDPYVFKTISHLDIEGLQDYCMSLINGSRRTLAGN